MYIKMCLIKDRPGLIVNMCSPFGIGTIIKFVADLYAGRGFPSTKTLLNGKYE